MFFEYIMQMEMAYTSQPRRRVCCSNQLSLFITFHVL